MRIFQRVPCSGVGTLACAPVLTRWMACPALEGSLEGGGIGKPQVGRELGQGDAAGVEAEDRSNGERIGSAFEAARLAAIAAALQA